MATHVRIIKGQWQKVDVTDKVFRLYKPFKAASADGKLGHVTVVGIPEEGFTNATCRIKCHVDDMVYLDETGNVVTIEEQVEVGAPATGFNFEKAYRESETDSEAMARIKRTFDMYEHIVESVPKGDIRGLIVSGPSGIGKSYTVQEVLGRMMRSDMKYEIVKGFASPISVYKALYTHSAKDHVLVFDDCDDALFDETALNLLKAALDTNSKRDVCWLAESRVLKIEDIPDRFEFNGGVIFLTNLDFEGSSAPKLKHHLEAMMSRCHYLDLEIGSTRDQMLRIKQMVADGLLEPYGLSSYQEMQIMDFIYQNFNFLRERSLRIVKKVAELYMSQPQCWKEFAEMTCLRKEARYERLYREKEMETSIALDINVGSTYHIAKNVCES